MNQSGKWKARVSCSCSDSPRRVRVCSKKKKCPTVAPPFIFFFSPTIRQTVLLYLFEKKKMSGQPKKRKYHDGKRRNNPRRGLPGILMTCETGRETKCEREGIDIMNHYSSSSTEQQQQQQQQQDGSSENETTTTTTTKKLSLEEELKMLRQQQKSHKKRGGGMFQVYETGCRGSVFVMCTRPGCNLIPLTSVQQQDTKKQRVDKTKDDLSLIHI